MGVQGGLSGRMSGVAVRMAEGNGGRAPILLLASGSGQRSAGQASHELIEWTVGIASLVGFLGSQV